MTDSVIRKIEALLNTSGRTEEEAALCIAKAQELLEKHNLSMADLGTSKTGAHGERKDNKRKGGLYKWQRTLWEEVAKLNFCHYISIKGLQAGAKYEHRVIGSPINVLATEQMADYLQATVERIAKQWAHSHEINVFCREAIAYREGMTSRLSERLNTLREERVKEQERKKREEDMRSRHPGAAPTSTALTIVQHAQNEEELNQDHLYGLEPGTTTARRLAREARHAALKAEREEWVKNNPEEAAARDRQRQEDLDRWYKEQLKREARNAKRRKGTGYRTRQATPEEERAQMREFHQGRTRADDIGLDQQIDKEDRKEVK